jgi:hypothetical protein
MRFGLERGSRRAVPPAGGRLFVGPQEDQVNSVYGTTFAHVHFDVPLPGTEGVAAQIVAVNKRLNVISDKEEQAAMDALEAHSKGKPS